MHAIRLRRPWFKRVVKGDGEDATDAARVDPGAQVDPGTRVDVPDDVRDESPGRVAYGDVEYGCVVYERRFNRPTGIDGATRLWLDIGGWSGRLREVRLNDVPLALGRSPLRVEVTEQIDAHNRIVVSLERSGDEPPRLSGEVRLLIEESPGATAER